MSQPSPIYRILETSISYLYELSRVCEEIYDRLFLETVVVRANVEIQTYSSTPDSQESNQQVEHPIAVSWIQPWDLIHTQSKRILCLRLPSPHDSILDVRTYSNIDCMLEQESCSICFLLCFSLQIDNNGILVKFPSPQLLLLFVNVNTRVEQNNERTYDPRLRRWPYTNCISP